MRSTATLVIMLMVMLYIIALPVVMTLTSAFGYQWGTVDAGVVLTLVWFISLVVFLIYVCNTKYWKNSKDRSW